MWCHQEELTTTTDQHSAGHRWLQRLWALQLLRPLPPVLRVQELLHPGGLSDQGSGSGEWISTITDHLSFLVHKSFEISKEFFFHWMNTRSWPCNYNLCFLFIGIFSMPYLCGSEKKKKNVYTNLLSKTYAQRPLYNSETIIMPWIMNVYSNKKGLITSKQ